MGGRAGEGGIGGGLGRVEELGEEKFRSEGKDCRLDDVYKGVLKETDLGCCALLAMIELKH